LGEQWRGISSHLLGCAIRKHKGKQLFSIYINLDLVEPTVFKEDDDAPLADNEGVADPSKVDRDLLSVLEA
jgi:hypothetical protein